MGHPVSEITKIRVDGKNADPPFPIQFLKCRNLDRMDHLVYGDYFHNIVNWFRVNEMRECRVEASDIVYCVCGTYRKEKWEPTKFYKEPQSRVVRRIKEAADNLGEVAEVASLAATGNLPAIGVHAGVKLLGPLYRAIATRKHYFVVLTQDDSKQPIHTKYVEGQEQCWMAADWKNPVPPKNKTIVTYEQIYNALLNQRAL